MKKRFVIGVIIGCVLSISITLGFGIENALLSFVIGVCCGAGSVGVALSI